MHSLSNKASSSTTNAVPQLTELDIIRNILDFDLLKSVSIDPYSIQINFQKISFVDVVKSLLNGVNSDCSACIVSTAIWNECDWNTFLIFSKHHAIYDFMQCSIPSNRNQGRKLIDIYF